MNRKILDILIIVIAAGIVYYGSTFIGYSAPESSTQSSQQIDLSYEELAKKISTEINDISPTPPTSETWVVEQIDFVTDADLAYVIYHDTHNIFRILVKDEQTGGTIRLKSVASFELKSTNPKEWTLVAGTDLGLNKTLISYTLDPETEIWKEKE